MSKSWKEVNICGDFVQVSDLTAECLFLRILQPGESVADSGVNLIGKKVLPVSHLLRHAMFLWMPAGIEIPKSGCCRSGTTHVVFIEHNGKSPLYNR